MIRHFRRVFAQFVRPIVEEALIGVRTAHANGCIWVAVEVQDGGGRKRGIRGGIVHVDGKEGDVRKGGGEKEGCDVTIADMLNGRFF